MSDANRPLKSSYKIEPAYKESPIKVRVLTDAPQGIPRPDELFKSAPLRHPGTFINKVKERKDIQPVAGGEVRRPVKEELKKMENKRTDLLSRIALFEHKEEMIFDMVNLDNALSKDEVSGFEKTGRELDEEVTALKEKINTASELEALGTEEENLASLELKLNELTKAVKEKIKQALGEKKTAEAVEDTSRKEGERKFLEENLTLLRESLPLFEEYAILKNRSLFVPGSAEVIMELENLKRIIQNVPTKSDVARFKESLTKLRTMVDEAQDASPEAPAADRTSETPPPQARNSQEVPVMPLESFKAPASDSGWPDESFAIEKKGNDEVWYHIDAKGEKKQVNGTFWSIEQENFRHVEERTRKYEHDRRLMDEFALDIKEIVSAIRNGDLALAAALREELGQKLDGLEERQHESAGVTPLVEPTESEASAPDTETLVARHIESYRENPATYIETYAYKMWPEGDKEKEVVEETIHRIYQELQSEKEAVNEAIRKKGVEQPITNKTREEIDDLRNKLQILDEEIKKISEFSYIKKLELLKNAASKNKALRPTPKPITLNVKSGEEKNEVIKVPIVESGIPARQPNFSTSIQRVDFETGEPLSPHEDNKGGASSSKNDNPAPQVDDVVQPQENTAAAKPEPALPEAPEAPIQIAEINIETSDDQNVSIEEVSSEERVPQEPLTPEAKKERTESVNKFMETVNESVFKKYGKTWKAILAVTVFGGAAALGHLYAKHVPGEEKKPTRLEQKVSWRDGLGKDDLTFISMTKAGFEGVIKAYAPHYKINPDNPETLRRVCKLDANDLLTKEEGYEGLDQQTREELCNVVAKAHTIIKAAEDKEGRDIALLTSNRDVPHMPLEDYVSLALKTATEADTLEARIAKMI